MSDPKRIGVTIDLKPHAYDPVLQPELFEGVLSRRILAFLIDVLVIIAPVVLATIVVFIFVLVTFGLAWPLVWLLSPGTVIWALFYYGATFASPASATLGMRVMGLTMRTWYGAPCYFVLGAVHAILFWLSVGTLIFPFLLVTGLFNGRRRLLHDILLGTVVINSAPLASAPATPAGNR
jgi:uncharacterized RDD family membrane protein YckC